MLRSAFLAFIALLAAACVQQPRKVSAPPDVSGRWDFSVDIGNQTARGEMWLFKRGGEMGSEFTGTLTPAGTNTLPVRALEVAGRQVAMTVDSAEGPVVFEGTLAEDANFMVGTVIYHQGQRFPLTARKRI